MVAVVKNGSVVGPCCWWQSFGRYEGSRCPISLIFRSLASSYSNIKANQLGFLLKQSVGSSLWCRLSVSSSIGLVDRSCRSVSSIGLVDRLWWQWKENQLPLFYNNASERQCSSCSISCRGTESATVVVDGSNKRTSKLCDKLI